MSQLPLFEEPHIIREALFLAVQLPLEFGVGELSIHEQGMSDPNSLAAMLIILFGDRQLYWGVFLEEEVLTHTVSAYNGHYGYGLYSGEDAEILDDCRKLLKKLN